MPTASALAISTRTAAAVSLGWQGQTFDVATAFQSGEKTERQVYIRAPREGLPATAGTDSISPLRIMEALKGAYGLAEAPRLWYLRARKLLEQAGFKELAVARAVFRLVSPEGKLAGLCTLHVDDGLLYGDPRRRTVKNLHWHS